MMSSPRQVDEGVGVAHGSRPSRVPPARRAWPPPTAAPGPSSRSRTSRTCGSRSTSSPTPSSATSRPTSSLTLTLHRVARARSRSRASVPAAGEPVVVGELSQSIIGAVVDEHEVVDDGGTRRFRLDQAEPYVTDETTARPAPTTGGRPSSVPRVPPHARPRAAQPSSIEEHLSLARTLARRFANRNEPLDDLEQVAMLGVLKAVERFDPEHGTPFAAFAIPTVVGELRRHFRDRGWMVRVPPPGPGPPPAHRHGRLRAQPAARPLAVTRPRSPTRPACATKTCSKRSTPGNRYRPTSLDVPRRAPTATPRTRAAPTSSSSRSRTAPRCCTCCERLPERERRVMYMRYFEDMTQPRSPRRSASARCTCRGCSPAASTSSERDRRRSKGVSRSGDHLVERVVVAAPHVFRGGTVNGPEKVEVSPMLAAPRIVTTTAVDVMQSLPTRLTGTPGTKAFTMRM